MENKLNLDVKDIVSRLIKYLVQGLAIAIVATIIPHKKLRPFEIATLALTAAAVFAVLDTLAPSISSYAKQGAGFGLGATLVGAPPLPGVPPLLH